MDKPGQSFNILFAAGGTGGHLFPALAVAESIMLLTAGKANISFVGNPNKLEAGIVPKQGFIFFPITIHGITGINLKLLTLPVKMIVATKRCRKIIRENSIDAVVCTGAYLSIPAGVAACFSKIPLFLMESNFNPGKAIRFLSSKAVAILTAFDETAGYLPRSVRPKIKTLGNPVRSSILKLPDKSLSREKFGLSPNLATVLVFGGSLGARSLNIAVEKNLAKIAASNWQLIWQSGSRYTAPKELPRNVAMLQFIEDMDSAYSAADLVVARSGATTVAELSVCGLPSLLVPLPSASTKEQQLNALALEKAGAATIVDDITIGEKLFDTLSALIADNIRLGQMASNALKLAKPDAAINCAREIIYFIKGSSKNCHSERSEESI